MGILSFPLVLAAATLGAQTTTPSAPSVVDNALTVTTVVSGLTMTISMAFIGPNDFLVLEKSTGQAKRVTNGAVASTVLDLAVNSNAEHGLLGIAVHPAFPANPGVYLYWSCTVAAPPASAPYTPTATECADQPVP